MSRVKSQKILSAATATGAGSSFESFDKDRTYQAAGATSASTGAATVKIQVSDDDSNWIDLATITLSLTTSSSSDGFATSAPWRYSRANVTAISGTGAAVTVWMGSEEC